VVLLSFLCSGYISILDVSQLVDLFQDIHALIGLLIVYQPVIKWNQF